MQTSTKEVKVTFFITGQDDKSKAITTGDLFRFVWEKHFENQSNVPVNQRKALRETSQKELVLWIDEFDENAGFYFGHVGVVRDTTLPTIFNRDTSTDSEIPLGDSDDIIEKSYFIYYVERDLLVFHQNHLGPRADDLAYMLHKASGKKRISFSPIWKSADIKSILETGSILKKGTITIALPRNFSESNLDLSNSWGNETIKMMSAHGMSRMSVNFWGRASSRKNQVGYIADTVKDGIVELLSKFAMGSERADNRTPRIVKAEASLTNGTSENLLSQELSKKIRVDVLNGYPKKKDMRTALIQAKNECMPSLLPFIRKTDKKICELASAN